MNLSYKIKNSLVEIAKQYTSKKISLKGLAK